MSTEVRPVTPYECPKCRALWLHWPKEQTGQATDSLNLRSDKSCNHCEPAGVDGLQRLDRVPPVSKLEAIARKFIADNRVTCEEACCNDRVYENAPNLVGELADVVGYYRDPDEEA